MSDNRSIEEIRERKLEELQTGQKQDSPSELIHIDGQSDLQDTVETHSVVLVDFYADWCGPCQMIEPIVEEIAAETDAVVAKVDIDANQRLASEYGVRGVPTLLLFADGESVERVVGMQNKGSLLDLIDQYTQS
ncbi:thioredoxin [Halocatena pleomorpha]|uniref:Thioredoxin n=1 Tax=Halocatena pleomorpha TaxID=1785090 RepID=A0A3P3RMV7_9EURY|nr:thioredoxin [Halocatena pleomorpha]RRJ34208.1 thioredoxin [Halocatena pleomorpha]